MKRKAEKLKRRGTGEMTMVEVGQQLGVGRGRVYNLETAAMRKLKSAFGSVGVASIEEFQLVDKNAFDSALDQLPNVVHSRSGRYASSSGWLVVDRVVSLNEGSEEPVDVARAYVYLKERNEKIVRPPLYTVRDGQSVEDYVVQGAVVYEGALRVRAWPVSDASRSVRGLEQYRVTALVESVFAKDSRGPFDIPVLVCVFAAMSRPEA